MFLVSIYRTVQSTMSELAPFVAAALRDKIMHEMCEEIKQLKQKLKQETDYWIFCLIDRRGSHVYATGKLSEREVLRQHVREEHQYLRPAMKADENSSCTFRHLCENVELEIATSCGKKIRRFIQELDPKLYIYDNGNTSLSIGFEFLNEQAFDSLHVYINLDDSKACLDEVKGGYVTCDLDWAFTNTELGDALVSLYNVDLYLDAKYLIQQLSDKDEDNDTDDEDQSENM